MNKKIIKVILALAIVMLCGCGKADESYKKAMELSEAGQYDKSVEYYKKAIKEDRKTEYYIGYGMSLYNMGQYDEAKNVFSEAIEKNKEESSKSEKKQLYYGEALVYYSLGEFQTAVGYCEKAIAITDLSDMDFNINFTKIMCLDKLEQNDEAISLCKSLKKKNKNEKDIYVLLGKILSKTGKNDDAVSVYQEYLEGRDDDEVYFLLYNEYVKMGAQDKADELLNKLVVLNYKKASNCMTIGKAFYFKGDYSSAEKYLNMAIDGKCFEAKYYLGIVYEKENKASDAEKTFAEYIKESKKDINVNVYNDLAVLKISARKFEQAIQYIEKGLSYGNVPARQNLQKNYIMVLEQQKKYKEALTKINEYVKCYPEDDEMKKEKTFIETRIK